MLDSAGGCDLLRVWWLLLIGSPDVALVPDVGGQIHDSALIGSRYLERAACAFYQTHEDRYDAIFVFSAIPFGPITRTPQGWAVKRAATGIGRDLWPDRSASYCTTRLRHAVKMGDIGSFSDDPDAIYTGVLDFTLSGVEAMGHEFGHHWLAAVTFDRGDGIRRCLLRAFTPPGDTPMNPDCEGYRNNDFNLHWSFFFNTGSVMYGNVIEDLGGGQFRLTNPGAKYSELDQYLMGLRDPDEVSPMFLVDVGPPSLESTAYPVERGTSQVISGERIDFTIDDIIRAEGPRVPARDMCHWKAAFIIVHEENAPPTAAEIARVDAYRRRWESFYAEATDRRGSFDTTLAGTGPGTPECPAPNVEPPIDAGVGFDASHEPDAGFGRDAADAMGSEPDAASPPPPDPIDAGEEDALRTLHTDDCSCRTARSEQSPWLLLLLASAWLGWRQIRVSRE